MRRALVQLMPLLALSMLTTTAEARECELYDSTPSSGTVSAELRWVPPDRDVEGNPLNALVDLKRYDIFLVSDPDNPIPIARVTPKEPTLDPELGVEVDSCLLQLDKSSLIAMKSIGETDSGKDDPSDMSGAITLP